MRTSWLGIIGSLLLGAAGVAHAQVELVYRVDGQAHVITGTERGRLIYMMDGKMHPPAGSGEWEIRPADTFAEPLGSLDVSYYFQPWLRQPALERDEKIELCYRLEFHPEETTKRLYCVCAWEVDGRLVAVGVRQFFDAEIKKSPWIFGQMPIKAADRRGTLRAYLFRDGKSLRGVSKRDLDLTVFRAQLDRGDTAGAGAWLQGPGHDRELPQALIEQIARSGDAGLLELALSGSGATHANGRDGRNLLLAAAECGREACVDLLLQRKVDPDAAGDEGSALYRAIAAQATGTVAKLLAAGAHPERAWDDRYSSLSKAIRSGNSEISLLLIDHGAKVPEKKKGEVFATVVAEGQADVVSLLLQREPNPDSLLHAIQPDGETPIMLAAYAGAEESVRVLQKAGASLTEHDQTNRTAAAWALKAGRGDLAVKLLKQAPLTGPTASRLLHDALLANNDELVALLLARDTSLDVGAADLDSVLELVVRTGNLPVLKHALSCGLDVDRKFNRDWNLAGLAERYHRPDVTAALEKQAGRKVESSRPKPEQLEVIAKKSGPSLGDAELGKDFHGGAAQVDIYIDAEGVPHAPMLRSTTDDRLGRAALANVLTWRFNRLPDRPNVWRRTIFPYDFPMTDPAAKFAVSYDFGDEMPWLSEETLPSVGDVGEQGIKQAGWVRFVVSASGEVLSPRVLAVTTPGIEDQVLAVMKTWHYYPATKAQVPIAYPQECVVILPGKVYAVPNSCFFLGKEGPDGFPRITLIDADVRTQRQRYSGELSKSALVLGTFTVDRSGTPGKLTILGSPGAKLANLAIATINDMHFKPLVLNGKTTEYPMAVVVVFRDPRDL